MEKIIYQKKASLDCRGKDAEYVVDFYKVFRKCKAWELDRNNDTCMDVMTDSGYINIVFTPNAETMCFPEDALRKRAYLIPVESARSLYREIREGIAYWYALDCANVLANAR